MATAGPSEDIDGERMDMSACNAETLSRCYQLIDKVSKIKPALEGIHKSQDTSPIIAVDCEGEELSRKGELALVSIATKDDIYIFDIVELGEGVFDEGLRDILEDSTREKLMFDCRQDSDCLGHQFRVHLANVLDLQLMQVIYREDNPDSKKRRRLFDYKPEKQVRSFLFCLNEYVKDDGLIKAKEAGKDNMSTENIWTERPLNDVMLEYAACDVRGFFKLYDKLKIGYGSHDMERLRIASAEYLDFLRGRDTRSYDEYEKNSLLPMYVVPPKGSLTLPSGRSKQCDHCRRYFFVRDFSKTQLRKRNYACPVCKEIKRWFGVQALREKHWERDIDERARTLQYDEETYQGSDEDDLFDCGD